ncbi:hypothetical protein FGO68_gene11513 [Halteria grandinella]|uniref:Uncharacterized protein n=1 Tax=Halteria grandinella TaxID=5974 RepID=A0A8J8NZX5_HALGN|nr:hypothetical protein FGO68_gene11513 [Halteria grandinella]
MSAILLSTIAYVWSLDANLSDSNDRRNATAQTVYISSLVLLIADIAMNAAFQNIQETFTKIVFNLVKPIILVNGPQSTLTIVMLIVQLLSIKSFVIKLKLRPHILTYATLIYFTLLQYFYRTGHRERISSIQFQKAFLGFPQYNYFINGFLVVLNTFSSHALGFFLVPYLCFGLNLDYNGQKLYRYMVFLSVFLFLFSALHATLSIQSLNFPLRYAPKTIFDVFFTQVYIGFGLLFMWPLKHSFHPKVDYCQQNDERDSQNDDIGPQ